MAGRFVIHAHSGHGPRHYDLMLERGEALATWQLAQDPVETGGRRPARARRIQDHRLAYLTYEGPVSGGRGRVDRIDAGTCKLLAVAEERWEFDLCGQRLTGRFELRRTGDRRERWVFRAVSSPATSSPDAQEA